MNTETIIDDVDVIEDYDYNNKNEIEEDNKLYELAAEVSLILVVIGIEKFAPHLKKWWNNKVVPKTKIKINRFLKKDGKK